jgi:predicted RNA binding protein YcfA (HicA-like mRNA interferase family)
MDTEWLNQPSPRDWKELRRRLESNGYMIVRGKGKHPYKVVRPNGSIAMPLPGTSGDRKAVRACWMQFSNRERGRR